jgi:hypothetical protein
LSTIEKVRVPGTYLVLLARSTRKSLLNSLGLEEWKVAIFNAIDDVSDHSDSR